MDKSILELTPFAGLVWRIVFADQNQEACEPVKSPVGRFHHNEQVALYASCTEEGAGVAIKRYLKLNDPARIIVPLQINADRIYDIRKTNDSSRASLVWQDCIGKGERAPTWHYSDAAREAGAQGMLYSSRSRPDLTHIVLFDVSIGIVKQSAGSKAWNHSLL